MRSDSQLVEETVGGQRIIRALHIAYFRKVTHQGTER
jgi:hypothetical protein